MVRDLYYLDTETVGLVGPIVLLQYTRPGSRDVVLHHVWQHTPRETMTLIEEIMDVGYVAFNSTFDHFHLQKLYCMLWALGPKWWNRPMRDVSPAHFASVERRAVFGPCVKARVIVDLFSHVRSDVMQRFLARESAWIYSVPEQLASGVAAELNARLDLDPFYFSGLSPEKTGWTIEDEDCEPGFRNLQLRFKAKLTLKRVHEYVFGEVRDSLPVPKEIMPEDRQPKAGKNQKMSWSWMPYAEKCEYQGTTRGRTWVDVITENVKFWAETESTYAQDDVIMLHELDEWMRYPEPNDNDVLTGVVASVRYRGYPVDLLSIRADLEQCLKTVEELEDRLGCSLDQHAVIKQKLIEACDDELTATAVTGSNAQVLKSLKRLGGDVADLATAIEDGRTAKKKAVWLSKLLITGRFHPSLTVVGTNTNRMSGADSLNPQGIDKSHATRAMFPMQDTLQGIRDYLMDYDPYWGEDVEYGWFYEELTREYAALGDFTLAGGDFDGFETAIAVAVWNEERLGELVLQGIKAYHVFGSYVFGDLIPQAARQRYTKARQRHHERSMPRAKARVLATREGAAFKPKDGLYYIQRASFKDQFGAKAKNCWYALVYGAQERKIADTAGLTVEQVEGGIKRMSAELPDMAAARMEVFAALTVLRPLPDRGFELVEGRNIFNLQGYERDFTRERQLIGQIFDFFTNVPARWREIPGELVRNEKKGSQSLYGCVISACIGGAMRLQARMQRQGTNFQMQSAGAMICKECQVSIWELQPVGVSPWLVLPMNVHDEILAAIRKTLTVMDNVYRVVEKWRPRIPLILIEWKEGISSWADK